MPNAAGGVLAARRKQRRPYRTSFSTQPDGGRTGAAFTQQPIVRVLRKDGTVATDFTGNVTLSLYAGTGTLGGTVTLACVAGVATFTNVQVTGTGHHVLLATVTGLYSARSGSMTIMPAATTARTVLDWNSSTSAKIDCGSGASLDDLTAANMSFLCRIKRVATGSNQFFLSKYGAGTNYGWAAQLTVTGGTEGTISVQTAFASGTSSAYSTTNSSNGLTQDVWYDVYAEWDSTTKKWAIFYAPCGSTLTETSGYYEQTAGTGTRDSDAASNLWIGGLQRVTTVAAKCHHEAHAIFAKKLSAAERLTCQIGFDRQNVGMVTGIGSCKGLWWTNTTGTVTDQSGNSNDGTPSNMATTTGRTYFVPTVWGQAKDAVDETSYLDPGSSAVLAFTTDATSVIVGAERILSGSTYDNVCSVTARIDGAYQTEALVSAVGKAYVTLTLPAGSNKNVEIVCGPGSRVGSAGTGDGQLAVGITSLVFNNTTSDVIPATPEAHIVTLHDSILDGFLTSPVGQHGPLIQLRESLAGVPALTASIGYGGQTWYKLIHDSTALAATVAAIAALSPTMVLMHLGINDYGNGGVWSASSLGSALATFLSDLVTELPDLDIRLVTPCTLATGEGANPLGDTLDDYRTAISGAASGISQITVFDGPTDLWDGTNTAADGTHPNNTGADAMAAALASIAA